MPNEFFLTARQTTKMRNHFTINILTNVKLSKAQISKINQSSGSFGSWLGNLGKKALRNVDITFTKDNLPGLVSNIASNAIKNSERDISEKEAVGAETGFTLFTSVEDTNNINKIIKSLENSSGIN